MPLRQDWVIVAEPIWDQVLKGDPITGQVIDAELGSNCHLTDSKIILIAGQQLAEFMIEHNIGASPMASYTIKRLDTDYFMED